MFRRALQLACAIMTTAALHAAGNRAPAPLSPILPDADISFVSDLSPTFQENAGSVTISIQRTRNVTISVSAHLSTEFWNGTPGPMPFGTPSSTTISFEPHETLKTVTIPILNDNVWSRERYAAIVLRDASPYTSLGGQPLGSPAWIWARVQDDEPMPALVVSNLTVPESNSGSHGGAFTVTLSPALGTDATANQPLQLSAHYSLVDGTAKRGIDYSGFSGTLNFDTAHPQLTIPFEIIGNTTPEPLKTFKVHFDYDIDTPLSMRPRLPADATCTILNDDVALKPSNARIARGTTVKFSLDIGLPAASALEIPLHSSDPSTFSLPASVRLDAGQSIATFAGTAAGTGSSKVSLTLPAENGGGMLSAMIVVFESGSAVFDPAAITIFTGEEATVHLSLMPASARDESLPLMTGNANVATVAGTMVIPAGGTGTFTVKGIAPGATYVQAILPAIFGSGYVIASVDVIDKPPIPTIIGIEPSSGPAAGGTPFLARGSLLTADCTLSFGGAFAPSLTLTSDGMLAGTTPSHAPGAVDVLLQCGSDTFVLTKAFTFAGVPRTRSARH